MTNRPAGSSRRGAEHVALEGATREHRYRPPRLNAAELSRPVRCSFEAEGNRFDDLPVADLGPNGLGVELDCAVALRPGARVRELALRHGEQDLWHGQAEVAYHLDTKPGRIGLRLLDGVLDLSRLRWSDELEGLLQEERACRERLPAEYRLVVGHLGQLLSGVRDAIDRLEEGRKSTWWRNGGDHVDRCRECYERWAPRFRESLIELDGLASALPEEDRRLADRFASRELLPWLLPCPMHRRAALKPRGYAGDYRLMLLYFAPDLEGESLYARFLHHVARNYELAHTVIDRERMLRERVCEAAARHRREAGGAPFRVVNLAAGAAIELRRWLEETEPLDFPVELVLIDQDPESLAYAQDALAETIASRPEALPRVRLHCLHFSVRQVIDPRDEKELDVLESFVDGADLVLSAGLFDYLPQETARALVRSLWDRLGPRGGLFLGNLERVPETSWLMEAVLNWHLRYRDSDEMLDLASEIASQGSSPEVVRDATGHCLFLDARRPAD